MKASATRRRDMARRAVALFIPILIAAVCCSACSPNAAETEKTPVAGTWKATALVADAGKQSEKIVPIDSVEQLASLYDGFVLTLGEDGTFDYLQSPLVCRGRYSRDDDAREDRYILETETTEFGSKVTRAEKGSGKLYHAELLGDGTLRVSAYDRILRSPDHREFPIRTRRYPTPRTSRISTSAKRINRAPRTLPQQNQARNRTGNTRRSWTSTPGSSRAAHPSSHRSTCLKQRG